VARRECNMVKSLFLIRVAAILLVLVPLCFTGTSYALELDANDDNILDSTYKIDGDNLTGALETFVETLQSIEGVAIVESGTPRTGVADTDYLTPGTAASTYEPADANIMHLDDTSEIAGLSHDSSPETTDKIMTEVTATGAKAYTTVAELLSVTQSDAIPTYASLAALEAVDGGDISDDDLAVVVADQNLYLYVADADGVAVWDSGTTYDAGDYVYNDSVGYICILESTDNEPPNATYWMVASPTFLIPDTTTGTISWELQLWIADGVIKVNTLAAATQVVATSGNINLTEAQMNSFITVTGAAAVTIPDAMCETATGVKLVVGQDGTFAVSVNSADGDDEFMLTNGSVVDDVASEGAAGNQLGFLCFKPHVWKVTGAIGTNTEATP
jgi:hypothetical protein